MIAAPASNVAHLFLMGEPRLIAASGRPVRLPPKAFALATVIALAKSPVVSRSVTAELLWGSSDRRHGNLRKLLWATRTALRGAGTDLFVSQNTTIALSATDLVIDIIQLHVLIDDATFTDLGHLCTLYRGDLLESLTIDSPEFNEWIDVQRDRHRDTFLNALTSRLGAIRHDHDRAAHKAASRRILEIDPYNETACRTLMQIQAEEGESAQVRDTFRGMATRLADDLSAAPAAATTELFRELTSAETVAALAAPRPVDDAGSKPDARSCAPVSGRPVSGMPTVVILDPKRSPATEATSLAETLLEDLTVALCRCKTLRVRFPGGTSSRAAECRPAPIDYAIESSVTTTDDGARLTICLIRSPDREVVWADQVKVRPGQPRAWLIELQAAAAASLLARIAFIEHAAISADRQTTAYQWYLAGQDYLRTLDLPSIRRGRRVLRASRDIYPNFAPSIGALARSFGLEWLLLGRGDHDSLIEALKLARHAIKLDPDDSAGYRALGMAQLYQKSFAASLAAYHRADRLNPHCPDLLAEYADALACRGGLDEARPLIEEAFRLNPVPPDFYHRTSAVIHLLSGAFARAIEAAGPVKGLGVMHRLLACCHARCGNLDQARGYVAKVLEVHPDFTVDAWTKLVPLQDEPLRQHCAEGLRLAGFP